MVPAWIAVAAWLAGWTGLALISMRLLSRVRPGETVPMRRTARGEPAWRVAPGVAAAFTPALSVIVGLVTIVAGFTAMGGQAPTANVLLPLVFVVAHWLQVSTGLKILEQERERR